MSFSELLRSSCRLLLLDVHLSLVTCWALLVLAVIHHILLVLPTYGRILLVHRLSSTRLLLFALFHGLPEHVSRDHSSERRIGHSEEVTHWWKRWHVTSHRVLFSLSKASRSDNFRRAFLRELLQIFSRWSHVLGIIHLHSTCRHCSVFRYCLHIVLSISAKSTAIVRFVGAMWDASAHKACLIHGLGGRAHDRKRACLSPATQIDHLLTASCHENLCIFLSSLSEFRFNLLKLRLIPSYRLLIKVALLLQTCKLAFVGAAKPAAFKGQLELLALDFQGVLFLLVEFNELLFQREAVALTKHSLASQRSLHNLAALRRSLLLDLIVLRLTLLNLCIYLEN